MYMFQSLILNLGLILYVIRVSYDYLYSHFFEHITVLTNELRTIQ
jgi:hypothetical protein